MRCPGWLIAWVKGGSVVGVRGWWKDRPVWQGGWLRRRVGSVGIRTGVVTTWDECSENGDVQES